MSARTRILERVRTAIAGRERPEHPGDFGGWRPAALGGAVTEKLGAQIGKETGGPVGAGGNGKPVDGFEALFRAAGGEVVRLRDRDAVTAWIAEFARDFTSVTIGQTVPPELEPEIPRCPPEDAALGISMARAGVAETGSLVMDARDGRRTQLLAPTHVVLVGAGSIYPTLRDALADMRADLPSAIGFHSGPSKSADIGQIMVKGVHGPGRVVALVEGVASSIEDSQNDE